MQDKTYFTLKWFLNRNDYTGETSQNGKLSLAEGILSAKALREEYAWQVEEAQSS